MLQMRKRRILLGVSAALAILAWWFTPAVWRLPEGPVTVTRWQKKTGKIEATIGQGLKGWISTKRVSRHVLHAFIASEDGKFYQHGGIDWESIIESARYNWKHKRYARGGSTISQQVVKMAFLGREKSLVRKAREAAGTLLMELLLSKDEILEWYMNLAEFGDGVYGIEAGSRHYFHTKPELLTIEQAVHLALVLPSPNAWSRGLRNRTLTKFGHQRFAAILNNMRTSGHITAIQWETAVSRGDFGRPLSGAAKMLAANAGKKPLCPGSPGCPEDEVPEDEELVFPPPGRGPPGAPPDVVVTPAPGAPLEAVTPGATPGPAPATETPVATDPSVDVPPPTPAPVEAASPPLAAPEPTPPAVPGIEGDAEPLVPGGVD